MRLLSLVFSFLVLHIGVCANPYRFSRITSNGGLSENTVKAIMQDHLGFVWFGTKNGLNRYDCNTVKHYDVDDLVKRDGNHNIAALYEDNDHRIWVGTDRGVYIYDPYTERFTKFDVKTGSGKTISNWISQIVGDRDGNIWVIAPNQGAFRYDTGKGTLKLFRTSDEGGSSLHHNPQSLCVLPDGEVWVGTNGAGLFRYDRHADELIGNVVDCGDDGTLAEKNIYTMCEYGGWIVLGIHEGKLLKYNPRTGRLAEMAAPRVHYKVIRSVVSDGDELFVATHDGLFIINETKNTEEQIKAASDMVYGLPDNMIYSLAIDRNHGLWIGTMMSGACYMPRRDIVFSAYLPMRVPGALSGKRVREMLCDSDGNVWISNEEGGVDVFNPSTGAITNINTTIYKGGSNRLAMMSDGGKIWSGIFKNGVDVIDTRTHGIVHYTPEMLGLKDEGSVYSLMRDSKGTVWLGTGSGVYMQSDGMRFTKITTLPDIFVQDMVEDAAGNVWIAAMGMGVYCVNPKTWRSVNYVMERGRDGSLPSNDVSSISKDHAGNLWFSTDRGGICMFDRATGRFTSYSKADGLPDDVAYKIMEDKNHYLWFGTNHGIVRFKAGTKDITVYRNRNGLMSNSYNYKSAVVTPGGKFIFGGTDGIVVFDPLVAGSTSSGKKVYITNLRVNNQDVVPEKDGILETSILYADEIRLPYDMSNISMDFSSLNSFGMESSNNYEYMLDGVDDDWNITQDGHSIVYSQLQPGNYTFKVRPVGDGKHVTELKVRVSPPWYSSLLAYVVYVLLLFVALYLIWRRIQERQMSVMRERERTFMAAKDKELLTAKINFFTDVTHEIRTPLTLIGGSVENLNELMENSTPADEKVGKAFEKNVKAINKNTQRLLNLVNQLLDFRKMDSNSITLNFINICVSRMMEEIVSRFEPTISHMNKTISLDLEDDNINIAADGEALTKIVSNLLNNARKYSETFIQVVVRVDGDRLEMRFINDGGKIPVEKAEEIFKPFTQLDNTHVLPGSGLGLPMARALAEMHGGRLVLNTASEYNEFVLTLPLTQENVIETITAPDSFIDDGIKDDTIADYSAGTRGGGKEYTVLVVEDNEEVVQMVADNLKEAYNVLTAKNGRMGLELVRNEHVDIVISDVMMPVMDGQEMCRRIKNDIELSHIPVILLTARQTLENRIDGLKAGADAYIEKPFSMGYLKVQVDTLLTNRRRERESFIHKPYLPVQSSAVNKQEEEFMSRISELIIKNIKQPEFNVEQLAAEMCMSRSSLHRKIKEVSNLTPIDFIRIIRLKKAAELIKEHGYRSSEVCEMVGISSPSYFIKLFQKQFGMTPKQFAAKKEG